MSRTQWAMLLGMAAIVGCSESGPTNPEASPSFSHIAGDPAEVGHFVLCKEGTAAEFDVDIDSAPSTVSLDAGTCQEIWRSPDGGGSATVTVSEVPNPGLYQLDHIDVQTFDVHGNTTSETLTSTSVFSTAINADVGYIVTFHNAPTADGRMTGGGGQVVLGDVRISRGFTLHCDIDLSNNLQINWPDNRWHIDKPLTSALCLDDPAIDPQPPAAPFDTFVGHGEGSLNGVPGSSVAFTFVDSGEPGGKADLAAIRIWSPGGSLVLDVPLQVLDRGNLQAHYDQPHGQRP